MEDRGFVKKMVHCVFEFDKQAEKLKMMKNNKVEHEKERNRFYTTIRQSELLPVIKGIKLEKNYSLKCSTMLL